MRRPILITGGMGFEQTNLWFIDHQILRVRVQSGAYEE